MQLNYVWFVWGFFCLCSSTVNAQNSSVTTQAGTVYRVILNVFSGRPDPERDIDETYPMYDALANAIDACHTTQLPDVLGYRGMTIVATDVYGNSLWKTIGCMSNVELQNMLLDTYENLEPEVVLHVRNVIQRQIRYHNTFNPLVNGLSLQLELSLTDSFLPHPLAFEPEEILNLMMPSLRRKKRQAWCQAPPYEPHFWNNNYYRRRNNNCYNYATNIVTNTFAQPGRGSGRIFRSITSRELTNACIRDGLVQERFVVHGCMLALYIWPGIDYHFYRLDSNNMWSHKRGATEAKNVDESNYLIMHPHHADRGPYTQFVSFFSKNGQLTIR